MDQYENIPGRHRFGDRPPESVRVNAALVLCILALLCFWGWIAYKAVQWWPS